MKPDKSIPLSIRLYETPAQVRRVMRGGRLAYQSTLYYSEALIHRSGAEVTVRRIAGGRLRVMDANGHLVCYAPPISHLETA